MLIVRYPHSFYPLTLKIPRRYRRRSIHLPPCLQEHVQLWSYLECVQLVDEGRDSENFLCHLERTVSYLLAEYSYV